MISFSSHGSFKNTEAFLQRMSKFRLEKFLKGKGQDGVRALAMATPKESGLAAQSWAVKVSTSGSGCTITWLNHDVENGFPVAIMLQYGYATGTGGYVSGRDYINPAIKPVFDRIANDVWKVVTSA